MTESISREFVVPHRPEAVWRALTDSDVLAEWLMPNDFVPRVGHRFTFRTQPLPQFGFDGVVHCEVLECDAPSRLAYSWAGGSLDTRVTYRLEPEGDGTRVHFEHSGFDLAEPYNAAAYRGMSPGWATLEQGLERVLAARAAGG